MLINLSKITPLLLLILRLMREFLLVIKQCQTVSYKLDGCESEKEIPHAQTSLKSSFCKEHKTHCGMIERTAHQAPASAPCEAEFQLLQHLPTQNAHPQKADEVTAIIGSPLEFQATVGGLQTVTCLDTGAGLNAISRELTQKHGFKTEEIRELETPFRIAMGNSTQTLAKQAIATTFQFGECTAKLWFLIVDHLPVQCLISRPTSHRMRIAYNPSDNTITYRGKFQTQANPPSDLSNQMDPLALEHLKIFGHARLLHAQAVRAKCPPRALKTITLKLVRPITSPQGFFIPIVTGGGKLLAFPGLVDIHSDGEITLLVANPTAQTVTNTRQSRAWKSLHGQRTRCG